jgi:(2S)-methylsuccinyl-CoA dehydrogenase
MSETSVKPVELKEVERLLGVTESVVDEAVEVARKRTNGGKGIDAEQVHSERLAYLATELRAARDLLEYAKAAAGSGNANPLVEEMTGVFAAEVAQRLSSAVDGHPREFGIGDERLNATLGENSVKACERAYVDDARVRAIGARAIAERGVNHSWIDGEIALMTRDSVRQFADTEVAPIAEHIHRTDDLVSDELIGKMAELGFFGMAVPEEYGGGGMGNLPMIVTTEELSRRPLAAAGSLITRPEILTKALLKGGSEEQIRDQRRQGVVHLCRPRRRPGAAGTHRPGHEERGTRAVAVHRRQGPLRRP